MSVVLGKLQHWAGSGHTASPVAGEREIRTDGVEEDAVNPFDNLYIIYLPDEKANCRNYIF